LLLLRPLLCKNNRIGKTMRSKTALLRRLKKLELHRKSQIEMSKEDLLKLLRLPE